MRLGSYYLLTRFIPVILFWAVPLAGQEAESGLEVRATVSGEAIYSRVLSAGPRNGTPLDGAFRAVVYPTLKLSENWTVAGAVQFTSDPYFTEDFETPGHAVTTRILRANIGYSRLWNRGSISIRAGQLASAVGAFNLRYDDAVNPLIDVPILYGYYGRTSTAGVAGIQTDITAGKWDVRVQFVNSSQLDPRGLLDRDQYGNWEGGAGYTVRQGLRVGVSGARGPYLSRQWPYFFPGEDNPNRLPASAAGADVQFARGHWNIEGEWNWMLMPYREIPFFRQEGAYVEARRVLNPRWYAAVRSGYLSSGGSREDVYEMVAGYRPGTHELIKLGYEIDRNYAPGKTNRSFVLQFVTTVRAISLAWR